MGATGDPFMGSWSDPRMGLRSPPCMGGLRRGILSAREAASILGEKELEELDPRACLGLL